MNETLAQIEMEIPQWSSGGKAEVAKWGIAMKTLERIFYATNAQMVFYFPTDSTDFHGWLQIFFLERLMNLRYL